MPRISVHDNVYNYSFRIKKRFTREYFLRLKNYRIVDLVRKFKKIYPCLFADNGWDSSLDTASLLAPRVGAIK